MSQIEYSSIEPLVADEQVQGTSVAVTFRCPETSVEVCSTATLQKDTGIKADASRKVKRGLWSSLRRSVASAIRDTLGSGVAGRITRDVANSALSQQEQKTGFTKAEVRAAVVRAFESVQNRFTHDADTGRWLGVVEPDTSFARRLQQAPVIETFDRGVLARSLVELSCADGAVGDEERAFLGQFLDPALGTIEDFSAREPLTPGELSETTEAVRPTILMLAWATAMCDEDVADAEVERLGQLAMGMGIGADLADEVRNDAQRFLFEQALAGVYAGGSRDGEAFGEATSAARSMGLDDAAIESYDANYRKRCGIV